MTCIQAKDAGLINAYVQDPTYSIERLLREEWRGHRIEPPRAPGVHASDLSSCSRKVSYSLRGEPVTHLPPEADRRRFEIGHLAHQLIQSTLHKVAQRDSRISFVEEVNVREHCKNGLADRYKIESSCDGVLVFSEKGEQVFRLGVEIKSESSSSWKRRTAPEPKHVEQGMLYMACLDLPGMYFIYVDKESGDITPFAHPFIVPFDPEAWGVQEKKIQYILDKHAQGELAEREIGYHCTFCGYRGVCAPNAKPLPALRMPKKKES